MESKYTISDVKFFIEKAELEGKKIAFKYILHFIKSELRETTKKFETLYFQSEEWFDYLGKLSALNYINTECESALNALEKTVIKNI